MLYVEPNFRLHWDRLIPGIQIVRVRGGYDWRPEDVYTRLATDPNYGLVLDSEQGDEFAVVRVEIDPITSVRVLFVWIAYSATGDAITRLMPEWVELAKKLDCTSMRWVSNRNGYVRALQGTPGFRIDYSYSLVI